MTPIQVFENFVNTLFLVLNLAILARILMSWVSVPMDNPVARVLIDITDPILQPFRRIIPPIGMIDISPMVAVIVLQLFQRIILASIGASGY